MIRVPVLAASNGWETIDAPAAAITFGLWGHDVIRAPTGSDALTMLFAGNGNDVYTVSGYSTAVIDDSGGTDTLIADGLNLSSGTTFAFDIGQRHLLIGDAATGQTLYLLDWLDPSRVLETIQTADGTFDFGTFASRVTSGPIFQGSVNWEDIGRFGQAPRSTAEMNEAIDYYRFVDNTMSAADGHNTLPLSGPRADFTIEPFANDPSILVVTGPAESYGTLGVDRFAFTNGTLAFDIEGAAGQAFRLYNAAFGRQPDPGGLGFWVDRLDGDATLTGVAQGFLNSPEFQARYGVNPPDAAFVDALYQNVLGREGEPAGEAFWIDRLEGDATRAEVLVAFSESDENKASTIASVSDGMWMT